MIHFRAYSIFFRFNILLLFFSTPTEQSTIQRNKSINVTLPWLSVSGTQWVNENNTFVELKGCNLGNWLLIEFWMHNMRVEGLHDQYMMEQTLIERFNKTGKDILMETYHKNFISERDFPIIASFGFNLIRVPFWYTILEDDENPYRLKKNAWTYFDWVIDEAEAHGIYTILDLHGACGSQNWMDHSGRSGLNEYWTDNACRMRTLWLWSEIVDRYKNRSAVAGYNLLNEPWAAPGGTEQLKQNIYLIHDTIRLIDERHILIFPSWYNENDFWEAADFFSEAANIAFSTHPYPGLFPGNGDPIVETHLAHLKETVPEWDKLVHNKGVTMLIGEMNVVEKSAGGAEMMRHSYDVYEKYGWATTMWTYKLFTAKGGVGSGIWGMVTNAEGQFGPMVAVSTWDCPLPLGSVDFSDACKTSETRFRATQNGIHYLVIKAGTVGGGIIDVTIKNISLIDAITGDPIITSNFLDWRNLEISGDLQKEYISDENSFRLNCENNCNGGIFQISNLQAEMYYNLSGFLVFSELCDQAWTEIYIHYDEPVDGEDYLGDLPFGNEIDIHTSSFSDINEYFKNLSTMEYHVYEELRNWMTTENRTQYDDSDDDDDDNEKSNMTAGVIAGISIGSLIALCLLLFIVYYCFHRYCGSKEERTRILMTEDKNDMAP